MKKHLLILAMLLCLSAAAREKKLLNFDWKFKWGEVQDAQFVKFDDADWQTVQLPHDASIYGPFVKDTLGGNATNGYRPRNIGWYRKHFSLDASDIGKKIILEFEGVYRAAEVWVNGTYCGQFMNGYLDFEYDVTKWVVAGDNLIVVRYDNRNQKTSRWYTGEGIHRNVYLHVLESVHVDRYGTYVTTPKITDQQASVVVETQVLNECADSASIRLETRLISPEGQYVTSRSSVVPVKGGEKFKFHQEFNVASPERWDLDHPALYTVLTKVYADGKLLDTYETSFGIREVEFNPEQGFLLNGRKLFLKGVCLHHDLGPLGAASFENGWDKRLSVLKNELGCNAIRLSHNPYPKYVLDWCDRNGLLVFDEAYDKWDEQYYGQGKNFDDFWRSDVETFVKRDRNHPSVFIWSVGNEVYQQIRWENREKGVALAKEMVDFVHQLEPSRKVTYALYPNRYNSISQRIKGYEEMEPHPMAFYSDVMSVNYMARFFGKDHLKYPQLTFLISEEVTNDDGVNFLKYDHSYVAGQFYWGGTEYIGEAVKWPSKGWYRGLIDLCDNMKPSAYNVKGFYDKTPMVRIAVCDKPEKAVFWNDVKMSTIPKVTSWNWKEGDSLAVQVFSNCESMELFINNVSQGVLTHNPGKPEYIWKVKYVPGVIKALGSSYGKVVAEHQLQTSGKPYRIVLEADRDSMHANGLDLVYFNVKVLDQNNILVTNATNNIRFKVSGAGVNAGVGNGDISSNEWWQAENRSVYQGTCQLIVRSSRTKGKLVVEATSAGLKGAKLLLNVQ